MTISTFDGINRALKQAEGVANPEPNFKVLRDLPSQIFGLELSISDLQRDLADGRLRQSEHAAAVRNSIEQSHTFASPLGIDSLAQAALGNDSTYRQLLQAQAETEETLRKAKANLRMLRLNWELEMSIVQRHTAQVINQAMTHPIEVEFNNFNAPEVPALDDLIGKLLRNRASFYRQAATA